MFLSLNRWVGRLSPKPNEKVINNVVKCGEMWSKVVKKCIFLHRFVSN